MSATRRVTVRVLLYGSIFAYLIGDLLIFRGPLRLKYESTKSSISSSSNQAAANRLVATVSGRPITRSQLDRAVAAQLWLEGKLETDISPTELISHRQVVLDALIDQEILRFQAKALAPQLPVTDDEVDARLKRLQEKFPDENAFKLAIQAQGIANIQVLRERFISEIRQQKYIALRLTSATKLSERDAENWFAENKESLSLPERIEVRHIFLPTLDHPADEAKAKLESALGELISNKRDFATLANEISEDPATQKLGGNLGWMTRERLPSDLATSWFALEIHKPTLVRSQLGWHLVEVTAHITSEPKSFEQAKPEITAALESIKRHKASLDLRRSLRNASSGKIEIFAANMQ